MEDHFDGVMADLLEVDQKSSLFLARFYLDLNQ
jgi:hypothetical protein